MSLNRIYSYWETPKGKIKPAYIDLCYESLLKHCGDTFDIHRMSECDSPKELHTINHKTDWLRANLVYENGGFWIDADMLVMQDLTPLIKLVEEHGFCGIPGFFGAKRKNKLLKEWIRDMEKLFKSKKDMVFSDLILPLLKNSGFKEFEHFTKEMICPLYHTGEEFWRFFEDRELEDYVTDNTYIVTLYNSAFDEKVKNMTASELLNKPGWLLSKMFKKALDK